MSRPRNAIPRYCVGANGRAFCKPNGDFVSLGKDGPEAKLKYAALLERLQRETILAPVESVQAAPKLSTGISVNELCLAFVCHAGKEYIDGATGKPSAEVDCFKSATKYLRELFGLTPAAEFGPMRLRAVRERFIELDWSRGFINKSVGRIRQIFRWGVAHELVPSTVLDGLRALEPLKRGKGGVEHPKRHAVPLKHVEAMKAKLRQRNRDIVDLLLYTAARPAEILSLTTAMIQGRQTVDGVWIIDLQAHKTAHHGHERRLFFNRKAQAILLKYLRTDAPDKRLFPIQRKTLGQAVKDACDRAGVPVFTPHWLRHTAVTKARDAAGAEAAQKLAGHATIDMTAHYSRGAERAAVAAVKALG